MFTCSAPESFHWKMERINKLFHPSWSRKRLIQLQEFFNDKPLNSAICIGDTCKRCHSCYYKQTFSEKSSLLCEYCCIICILTHKKHNFSKLELSVSFISLVPDEIKTSALTGDTGYDSYLRDAHRQVLLYLKKTK